MIFREWDKYTKHKTPQLPKYFEPFDEKLTRLFKHCLNPRPKDRWHIKDLKKFMEKETFETNKATKVKTWIKNKVFCKKSQIKKIH
jgi:hypothetical protein